MGTYNANIFNVLVADRGMLLQQIHKTTKLSFYILSPYAFMDILYS